MQLEDSKEIQIEREGEIQLEDDREIPIHKRRRNPHLGTLGIVGEDCRPPGTPFTLLTSHYKSRLPQTTVAPTKEKRKAA